MKKFFIRTISGAVLLLLLCSAFFYGGIYLWLLLFGITVTGLTELLKAVGKNKKNSYINIALYAGTLIYYLLLFFTMKTEYLMGAIVLTLIMMMCVCVFDYPKHSFSEIAGSAFAFLYITVMLSFVYLTRMGENGLYLIWITIISSWGCDTCAYLVGCSIGKRRLAPVLSPKKSVEGAIGGSVGAGLIGALVGFGLHKFGKADIDFIMLFSIISLLASIASQIGDLMASAIKREYNIKDYGNIIPGHGGVLDRFDSMIVTAPIIFFLGVLFK